MDDARIASIVSPADAEKFFATGYNALTSEPDLPVTVDVPAVGATPATELPSLDSEPRANRHAWRDRALSELQSAALELAEVNIRGKGFTPPSLSCAECEFSEAFGTLSHATWCKTGRVMLALDLLRLSGGASVGTAQKGGAR